MLNCPFIILHSPVDKALPSLSFHLCLSTLWHFDVVPKCSLCLSVNCYDVLWADRDIFSSTYCVWRVCRWYWVWTAIRNILPTPQAGKIRPVSLWFVIFVSMHPSLLWALPLPLSSSSFPLPSFTKQWVNTVWAEEEKEKQERHFFFLEMQIQRHLNLLFGSKYLTSHPENLPTIFVVFYNLNDLKS